MSVRDCFMLFSALKPSEQRTEKHDPPTDLAVGQSILAVGQSMMDQLQQNSQCELALYYRLDMLEGTLHHTATHSTDQVHTQPTDPHSNTAGILSYH